MNDLQSLMAHIAKVWNCNAERYPDLHGMNAEQRHIYLLKHSLLHINMTAGKIAAVCERFDHNGMSANGDEAELQKAAVQLFNNALKLAEEAGLSASDLLTRAPQYIK